MTTNPWMIALINMTVVFGVLGALGIIISLIRYIDPTKKKPDVAAVPAAVPAPVIAAPIVTEDDSEIVAVIAAAIAAYGYGASQIACIRRLDGGAAWAQAARVEAVTLRNKMF